MERTTCTRFTVRKTWHDPRLCRFGAASCMNVRSNNGATWNYMFYPEPVEHPLK